MAQYLLFDGIFNTQYFGLQAYFWVMLAMFLVIAATNAIWYFFFWLPLTPVHGHFRAHVNHVNSAFTFNENLLFNLVSEKSAKLIFDMKVKDAKEAEKDWEIAPCGLIGRVQNDLVFDGGRWTDLTSPVRKNIERVAELWNEANPDDQVVSLGKFHRYLVARKFDGIPGVSEIPAKITVEWKRIDMAMPEDHEQPQWDGYLGQLAHKEDETNNSPNYTLAYVILAASFGICILLVAANVLMKH